MEPAHPKDPIPAAALFNIHAAAYLEKYRDISRYHPLLDLFAKAVQESGNKILDIACGPGLQLQYLQQLNPAFQLTGTDLAPNMIALARQLVPEATLLMQDCRDLSGMQKRYNGIIGSFVLPYLNYQEAKQLISDIDRLLDPGGQVYLGFIAGAYPDSQAVRTSGGETLMMYYYDEEMVTGMLAAAGIRITHSETLPSLDPRQTQQDIILIGRR